MSERRKTIRLLSTGFCLFGLLVGHACTRLGTDSQEGEWPVLKHYDQDHISKIAMPIGGIGTGTVSLSGRGELIDWEIMNRPAKGFNPSVEGGNSPFFALYTRNKDQPPVARAILGPIDYADYEGAKGSPASSHGLPRFNNCTFDAAYPFGQVHLSDDDIPVEVRLKAFNPLVPADPDASGIPIAILKYELTSKSEDTLDVSICGTMHNFIGINGAQQYRDWGGDWQPFGADSNVNQFKRSDLIQGILMTSNGVPNSSEAWGSITLSTTAKDGVTYQTGTGPMRWGSHKLRFWDDFSGDGKLAPMECQPGEHMPRAALAVSSILPPGETKEIEFLITWHFPNRPAWLNWEEEKTSLGLNNYYTTKYEDAWDVALKTVTDLDDLESRTLGFVNAFCKSDLPTYVMESALFNISTLRTQTCFRTDDGNLYGWEGCHDSRGCCPGSCTHVWNYEQATAFLFGDLAKRMRYVEFKHATDEIGLMSFRVLLPLERAQMQNSAAADGQMGCIMKIYRDWHLSGDDQFLKELWPDIKRALQFCWIPGGWDANRDGVMEGIQHNTMDVEYYGPNPQMEFWYLGALSAAARMATYIGDDDFADQCQQLFNDGSKWTEENLFNGEYFVHKIELPTDSVGGLEGLIVGEEIKNREDPEFQLGEGCLVDQLVGQFMAHVCGLGYLVDPDYIQTTLQSIMKYNYRETLIGHFNCMRSFALGDESGLLMASFPNGRPTIPFPYYSEVMTGFEYAAAIGMLYENQTEAGLLCIKNIRDRYDGKKRSPFNEAECGNHYARAMASWGAVLILSGFHYSAVDLTLTFTTQPGNYFWSNGHAFGTINLRRSGNDMELEFEVIEGKISFQNIVLKDFGKLELDVKDEISEGQKKIFKIIPDRI